MKNNKLLYSLIVYGVLMLSIWLLYTQHYVISHAMVRADSGSANKSRHLLSKFYYLATTSEDKFMYINRTLLNSPAEKENKEELVATIHPANITKFNIRQHYVSLANNTETLDYDCNQCALVSSSGQILGRGMGEEIDTNDCIIRMNNAPSGEFYKDVGNRTTIRMGSFNSAVPFSKQKHLFEGEGSPDIVVIWGLFQKQHIKILKLAKELPKMYPNTKFYAETLKGEDYAGAIFEKETGLSRKNTKTWLSTGWFTMVMAIDLCKKINLYGFIPEDHCQKNPGEIKKYHYYQNPNSSLVECKYYTWNEKRKGSGHRFVTEKAVFARWAERYNMTFHAPSWNIKTGKIETPFIQNQRKTKLVRKKVPAKRPRK